MTMIALIKPIRIPIKKAFQKLMVKIIFDSAMFKKTKNIKTEKNKRVIRESPKCIPNEDNKKVIKKLPTTTTA
jgi:hypothetical protein